MFEHKFGVCGLQQQKCYRIHEISLHSLYFYECSQPHTMRHCFGLVKNIEVRKRHANSSQMSPKLRLR